MLNAFHWRENGRQTAEPPPPARLITSKSKDPEVQRKVAEYRREGLSYEEAGAKLGISAAVAHRAAPGVKPGKSKA